jgi:hypothetical protein
VRKANVEEADGGFCEVLRWPPATWTSYLEFLEQAKVGSAGASTFLNGTLCRFYRVTDVYQGPTGKCVRYSWWSCESGKRCGRGEAADCKQANGEWK